MSVRFVDFVDNVIVSVYDKRFLNDEKKREITGTSFSEGSKARKDS